MVAGLYIAKTLYFFYQAPGFTYLWDWPGHLEKANIATWPWSGGWDNSFWGGHPTILYPNLFHLILKLFIGIASNNFLGVQLMVLGIFILQLWGLWILIGKFITGRNKNLVKNLAFLFTVIYMGARQNGVLMGSFVGTLAVGGGPGALGTAILFFLIAAKSWMTKGIFLGFLFLVHPLTAPVGLLYLILLFFQTLPSYKEGRKRIFQSLGSLVIGIMIGLPWILPSMDTSLNSISANLPAQNITGPLWMLLGLIFILLESRRYFRPVTLTAILVGILSALPMPVIRTVSEGFLQPLGIRGIAFYRYDWFLWLLAIPVLFSWLGNHGYFRIWLNNLNIPAKTFMFLALLIILIVESKPLKYPTMIFNFENISSFTGRVMDVSKDAAGLNYPQAMEHELIARTNLVGSTRWFYESGSQGFLYHSLKKAIEPNSFADGVWSNLFLDKDSKPLIPMDKDQVARILGINYIAFTSVEIPNEEEQVIDIGALEIPNKKGETIRVGYYLKQLNDEQLVVPLNFVPEYDKNANLMDWWQKTDHQTVLTDEEYLETDNLDLSKPYIDQITVEPTKISFFAAGNKPVPIFIKFSYSPYYEAKAMDSASMTSKPYWVTPGNMLVYGYGRIQLDWKTPWYMRIFSPISFGLALICCSILLANRIKPIRYLSDRS